MYKPVRRQDNLLVEQLQDECIIYDNSNKKIHHLNSTLALIWNHCDGVQTVDELGDTMRPQLGPQSVPEIIVTSLKQLAEANLLESNSIDVTALETPRTGVSRRSVIASAAAVAPGMVSILAPTPAAAKSKPDKIKPK